MPSARRTALIAGATGLVGQACLARLLAATEFSRVIALVRRPLEIVSPRLQVEVVDFDHPEQMRPFDVDAAFCALGTTIARAGSQAAFRAVDYGAVLAVADLAAQGAARDFVLVSSVGADASSGNFYLGVKGEAEAAVARRPFRAVHVLRPSLLLGDRQESRPAEAVFRRVAPLFNPLLLGPLRPYRAVAAEVVGAAMVEAVLEGTEGHRILFYDTIVALARAADRRPSPTSGSA